MILAQSQELRRDRLAGLALLRRLAEYTTRTTVAKLVAVAVAVAIVSASHRPLLPWLALVPAVAGLGLNVLALAVTTSEPKSALLRRYEAHLTRVQGRQQMNLPAIAES